MTSWSAIDSAGRCKPLYFALRDMYAPRVLTIEPRGDALEHVHHQRRRRGVALHGATRAAACRRVRCGGAVVPALRASALGGPHRAARRSSPSRGIRGKSSWSPRRRPASPLHFAPPSGAHAHAPLEVAVAVVAGGMDISVRSRLLARDVLVQPDRLHPDATVDRGFTTVLPGETAIFRVRRAGAARPRLGAGGVRRLLAAGYHRSRLTGACIGDDERCAGPAGHDRRCRARGPQTSTASVSYALNGRPGISEATRERVLEVAARLGWSPASAARALAGAGADTIGLVLTKDPRDLSVEPFYMQFIAGVESALTVRSRGLLLEVAADADAEVEAIRRWRRSRRVDGVLLTDLRPTISG